MEVEGVVVMVAILDPQDDEERWGHLQVMILGELQPRVRRYT